MSTYTPTRKELEDRFDAFFKLNLPDMQGTRTMAAHLAATFSREYIFIPRQDLPEVTMSAHMNGLVTALAQQDYQPSLKRAEGKPGPEFNMSIALANLALAEAIKERGDSEEKALKARRDELVRKFGGAGGSYAATDYPVQQAVDAYIELEQKMEAAK